MPIDMRKLRFCMADGKVTFSHRWTQSASLKPHLSSLDPLGNHRKHKCPPAPPLPCSTYNVHEREQVLLHVFLPVELDHRVIHTQQDLDVVVVIGSMSACPAPGAVDPFLQDAQGTAEAVQAAKGGPWKDRGHSVQLQPGSSGTQQQQDKLGTCLAPAWPSPCCKLIFFSLFTKSQTKFQRWQYDVPSQLKPDSIQITSSAIAEPLSGTQ